MYALLTIALLACIGVPAGEPPTEHEPPATSFVVHNTTAADAEIWINGTFIGRVGAGAAAAPVIAKSVWQRPGGDVAVTVASAGEKEFRMNSLVISVKEPTELKVIWGSLTAPDQPATPLVALPPVEKLSQLAEVRWGTLQKQSAGTPPRAVDTQIGTAFQGTPVRGEFLSVECGSDAYAINGAGMLFRRMPAGQFLVAQVGGPKGRQVTISKAFYMGVTEMTQGHLAILNGEAPVAGSDPELPLTMVTWQQAVDHCSALSQFDGQQYQLPTEVQWEYSCQAGTLAPFSPVGVDLNRIMWSSSNAKGRVQPVATRMASAAGLFDMHGNACEWCSSWWSYTPPVGVDPVGPVNGSERVRRGGSYMFPSTRGSCGARDCGIPSIAQPWQGFRVALIEAAAAPNSPPSP